MRKPRPKKERIIIYILSPLLFISCAIKELKRAYGNLYILKRFKDDLKDLMLQPQTREEIINEMLR